MSQNKFQIEFYEVWQLWALSGPECPKVPGMPKNVKKGPERLKVPKKTRKCPALQNLQKFYLELFLGLPLDVHENDQLRMNTKMIHISRDMLWNDLTSEPREAFELYRATTDPRIDAKGVMPIPM